MCGIVGYIGKKEAQPILLESLKRLEYRGYDSAGIATICNGEAFLCKQKGKIKDLEKVLNNTKPSLGFIGVSHTRWATHGVPNEINAHPHPDCTERILVVHNGIIENFLELKKVLIKEGHRFKSDTDTEVVSHLVEKFYNKNLEEAVLKAIKLLKGSYALGIINKEEPWKLVCARKESPLIVGLGRGENFIASDVPAILKYTKRVIYLDNEEIAVLTRDKVKVMDFSGRENKKKIDLIKWTLSSAQKGGFPNFMLKEIFEQPAVLRQIFSTRIKMGKIILEGLGLSEKMTREISNIIIIACGTAYHAGLVGKYLLEEFTRLPVWVDLSSEFRYRQPIIKKNTLVIAISQSGETADTLAAVKEAREKGARVISICNVVGSSITRISDGILYTHAGPEICVASTKAYIAQLGILYLLAFYIGGARGVLNKLTFNKLIAELKRLPNLVGEVISRNKEIKKIANAHSHFGSFLYLGRNINFPTALEGALKLKEISYIPAEGYAAGEMKHGPIALIDEYRAVVCIAPQSKVYEKMVSNIMEISSRNGKLIILGTEGDRRIRDYTKEVIYIPKTEEIFTPILCVVVLQLLAYYIAVRRGCDVDQPRNLAKSVTVE